MNKLKENDQELLNVCSGKFVGAVRYFISKGASVNALDENRTSPLHISCRTGNLQIVEELLNSGAFLNITDTGGWTALHIASYYKHTNLVSLLMKFGADPTITTSKKQTAYMLAKNLET
jgi:ankyrin repeat protein